MEPGSSGLYDAIVVGAGHNGLVAAFYLARAGLRVCVCERRSAVGGACITEELFPGYQVSAASYVVWALQPAIIRDMELQRRGFRYHLLDPWRLNPYRDGSHVTYYLDEARTQTEIARLNRHDADAYPRFNDFWRRAARLLAPFFLQDPPSLDQVRANARRVGEEALLDRLMCESVAGISGEFFQDTRIQAALVKMSEVGDPWQPGGALTEAYFHADVSMGYAVTEGGNGAITRAMAEACREQGAELCTDREVERILTDGGHVRGVRLRGGREIRAGTVVSNADPKRTLLGLVDAADLPLPFRRQVENLSTRTSYLKFHSIMERLPDLRRYLGRPAEPREVGYIHLAPGLEAFAAAHRDAMEGRPSRQPIVHIQIPTVYDHTLTRRQGHIVSTWTLYAPPRLADGTWEDRRAQVGEALIDYVTEFIPNFRQDMREWCLFTPRDLEERFGMTDGNIRHLDTVPAQFLDRRPLPGMGYATPIAGLYLCGAGTHPGGEVSGAPGHNAARAVLQARSDGRTASA